MAVAVPNFHALGADAVHLTVSVFTDSDCVEDIITVEAHANIYPETDEEGSRVPNGPRGTLAFLHSCV